MLDKHTAKYHADLLQVLQKVLDKAHDGHKYTGEPAGVDEWKVSLEGDCEDFVLWCRQELDTNHYVMSDLVLCTTETGQAHMVLSVEGWILDNRFNTVRRRDDLKGYKWLGIGKPDGRWYVLEDYDNYLKKRR